MNDIVHGDHVYTLAGGKYYHVGTSDEQVIEIEETMMELPTADDIINIYEKNGWDWWSGSMYNRLGWLFDSGPLEVCALGALSVATGGTDVLVDADHSHYVLDLPSAFKFGITNGNDGYRKLVAFDDYLYAHSKHPSNASEQDVADHLLWLQGYEVGEAVRKHFMKEEV